MKLSHPHRWDWPAAALLILMLQVATARLVITRWTSFLFFAQTLAALGGILGLALGYSQFKKRTIRWMAIGYSAIIIPWQLTLAIDQDVPLSERLASVGGRLLFSLQQFFQREAVDDGLLFVAFIAIAAWIISLVSGYWWTRHGNFLVAVLPGGVFALTIHMYDQTFTSRIWLLGIYLLLALLLLGRLYYLQNRESWRERRVFLMQESTFDLTRGLLITATLFIFISWTVPASQAGVDSAVQFWNRLTKPWREMQKWFSNAVDPLEAQSASTIPGDLFGSRLNLGTGNPLSAKVVISVQAPDLPEKQPRYYWRGYVYDQYQNYRWYATDSASDVFSPESSELRIPDVARRTIANFTVKTWIQQSLLYTATQPLWVSRPGQIVYAPTDSVEYDLFAWQSDTRLLAGEQYQVTAAITNPSIQQLANAGTDYPQWVTDRYLQLPEDFSPRINELANQITQGLDTPYDKAVAITRYLRNEIVYSNPLPEQPPEGVDPLEWMLFDIKQGFCNYYASAEVLMLRSQGIPARMAVGFAEGILDEEANSYTVRSLDAHAWPEVYFPGFGWIEFEPTGNQDVLVRPNRPEDEESPEARGDLDGILNPLGLDPTEDFPKRKLEFEEELGEEDNSQSIGVQSDTISFLYLAIAAFLIIVMWLLNRQYAVLDQIPVRLRSAYERNGGRVPAWLTNWAHWAVLTPIERSFETVNRSLRLLGESPALYATPAKRAEMLVKKLPEATKAIESLSEQHHASLFQPDPGNVSLARRASMFIWLYTIQSIIKRILYGRLIE